MGETLDLAQNADIDEFKGKTDTINMRDDKIITAGAMDDKSHINSRHVNSNLDLVVEEEDEDVARKYCESELELMKKINEKLKNKVKR